VVTVREDTPGDKRLVSYCVLEPGLSVSSRELRSFLREKLPAYMLPAATVFLDAFPLTPNGKIDRQALPSPSRTVAVPEQACLPPSTPLEIIVATAWKKVLKVEQISVFDNFFDLGGHSLLAMQAVAELKAQTGCRLEPAYFRFESLGQLAVTLEQKMQAAAGAPL
jgi:hypothetical protein